MAEFPTSFDCRATAALLHSGSSVALAGNVAAVIAAICIRSAGAIAFCVLIAWCAVVYLAIRVSIDARFFELLANHPVDQFDSWLNATGLRKTSTARTIQERRRGAIRIWRALIAAAAIEIAMTLIGVFRSLP